MNTRVNAPSTSWLAELSLTLSRRGDTTALVRRRHQGPLVVQRAFYPEGPEVAHLYVLHPPGGVVGGDVLRTTVQVEESAHALLTTPGATKLYRSAGATAELEQRLSVEAGGSLEWFPQETIAFSGVKAETSLSVRLADDGDAVSGHASFVGWDIVCLGRPGSGERFDAGKLVSSVEIHRHQHPIYCDRLEVDGGSRVLDAAWGLRGAPVLGTLLAVVPALAFQAVQAWVSTVGRALGAQPADRCEWRGVSALPDPRNQGMKSFGGVVLARYLGVSAERAKSWFVELWRELRPLLTGRQACVPRIWAT